ncbi:MAG: carboxypeptidase regulatory-like domain-containing protein [Bacteroidales bacterium]|nr:carboxypeptidase regulatory-like domain-containing protein [Bacteroidales bacterium]
MKRNSLIVFGLLLLLGGSHLRAQQAPDSVIVMGSVVNQMSGRPEPFSVVRLLQDTVVVATAPCDEEGWFGIHALPAGRYLLEVQTRGLTLYQADLVLQENASLNIGVITDSLRLVNLSEVKVVALRHLLGGQLIASPHDIRLWNLLYRKGGGDHSAAVSISPDMEPEYDELDAQNGVLRLLLPVGIPGKAYKYYLTDHGLNVSPDNSAMKNELLSEGRIRDTKRYVQADTTQAK